MLLQTDAHIQLPYRFGALLPGLSPRGGGGGGGKGDLKCGVFFGLGWVGGREKGREGGMGLFGGVWDEGARL